MPPGQRFEVDLRQIACDQRRGVRLAGAEETIGRDEGGGRGADKIGQYEIRLQRRDFADEMIDLDGTEGHETVGKNAPAAVSVSSRAMRLISQPQI